MKAFLLLTGLLTLSACTGKVDMSKPHDDYFSVLKSQPGALIKKAEVQRRFEKVFSNFTVDSLASTVVDVYAEDVYFNDTLLTIKSRDVLVDYFLDTAAKIEYMDVQVQDIIISGTDYYVRWTMDYDFKVLGSLKKTSSIGMTHLRFNENAEIIIHQDYWDSAKGFYQHIPVVGFLMSQVSPELDN